MERQVRVFGSGAPGMLYAYLPLASATPARPVASYRQIISTRHDRAIIAQETLVMNNQETYDQALDAPPPTSDAPAQAPTLPDEPYYRQPAPRRGTRNASLGVALVLVGLVLLAFQVLGSSLPIGSGSTIPLL